MKVEKITTGCWDICVKPWQRRPYCSPGEKRHAKRQLRRARRRLWRQLGEDAPTRGRDFTRGWIL